LRLKKLIETRFSSVRTSQSFQQFPQPTQQHQQLARPLGKVTEEWCR
jgi:hypothetical protein